MWLYVGTSLDSGIDWVGKLRWDFLPTHECGAEKMSIKETVRWTCFDYANIQLSRQSC